MSHLNLYENIGLNTDLYQLTMAQGYWDDGRQNDQAAFHLFFRSNPFDGGYAIAAGLGSAVEFIENHFGFDPDDLEYLSSLRGSDEKPLFQPSFLEYLRDLDFECDIHAVKEGRVVFPHEPLVRVEGPIIQAQLLETALLNFVNFQTLVATKAARIKQAAEGDPLLEFGLRRAQGVDGGVSAARGACIGGADGTSNVLAGKLLDLPVKGTHAHSWVQSYDVEEESFEAFAQSQPNNAVFLVDTYDTISGVEKAVEVGKRMREEGHEMVGVRLDSGDLAWLSKRAREILDDAGFEDAKIVASNSLDEMTIKSIKDQGGEVDVWGVGTNLATCKGDPALGGVYKLGAVKPEGGEWEPRIKLSEQRIKTSIPGRLDVLRYFKDGECQADVITSVHSNIPDQTPGTVIDPMDPARRVRIDHYQYEPLLEPVYQDGQLLENISEYTSINTAQIRRNRDFQSFHDGIKRFHNPHPHKVGIDQNLHEQRERLRTEGKNQ